MTFDGPIYLEFAVPDMSKVHVWEIRSDKIQTTHGIFFASSFCGYRFH